MDSICAPVSWRPPRVLRGRVHNRGSRCYFAAASRVERCVVGGYPAGLIAELSAPLNLHARNRLYIGLTSRRADCPEGDRAQWIGADLALHLTRLVKA